MNKVIEYLQNYQFDDATFFKAIRLNEVEEEQILFALKQLKKEKDLAYKIIDKLKENSNEK